MSKPGLILILMAAAVSVSLFVVKHRVQDLDDQLLFLNRDISKAQEAIHVLKSEWSHLNQPDRLRRLADSHLEMGPLSAEQVGNPNVVLVTLPDRVEDEVETGSSAEVTP